MANIKRLPGKAESMKYDGNLPDDVKIFDPGSMATLFKPQHVFIYEEPNTNIKVAFVYREYTSGDDLLIFDKPLIERDTKISKDVVNEETIQKKAEDLTTEEIIQLFEYNRHDAEVRDKTLQLCCIEPVLTDEILAVLSEDCKTQFHVQIMKGVRANSELVQEFQEESGESET